MDSAHRTASSDLPTYLLYGERGRAAKSEVLHFESIAERSRLHDWEIRPHRHESMFQFLYIERGRAEVSIDGASASVRGPCSVTVAPLSAHGFRFSPDVQGSVITALEPHLRRLLAHEPGLQAGVLRSGCTPLAAPQGRELRDVVASLRREFGIAAPWRALAIDAALLRLLVVLGRTTAEAAGADVEHTPRGLGYVRRFRALVEQRFREQPPLAVFADELGITPTQLNRVCRQVLGHSALAVLHARLVLEAQRELAYTSMSVKQVAFALGFTDAGYFTRFFQRETGHTPSAWREAAARGRPPAAQ
ncbi:MAG TPA: helix-turn-helix domain-containing protein [Albitalea sp.]|nr:helix-turn-helix domain-containing protein [Albitalea sp.]